MKKTAIRHVLESRSGLCERDINACWWELLEVRLAADPDKELVIRVQHVQPGDLDGGVLFHRVEGLAKHDLRQVRLRDYLHAEDERVYQLHPGAILCIALVIRVAAVHKHRACENVLGRQEACEILIRLQRVEVRVDARNRDPAVPLIRHADRERIVAEEVETWHVVHVAEHVLDVRASDRELQCGAAAAAAIAA
eukprot:scaffold825_cov249-Pinguiococcus_pyrenoidosus.AAC.25